MRPTSARITAATLLVPVIRAPMHPKREGNGIIGRRATVWALCAQARRASAKPLTVSTLRRLQVPLATRPGVARADCSSSDWSHPTTAKSCGSRAPLRARRWMHRPEAASVDRSSARKRQSSSSVSPMPALACLAMAQNGARVESVHAVMPLATLASHLPHLLPGYRRHPCIHRPYLHLRCPSFRRRRRYHRRHLVCLHPHSHRHRFHRRRRRHRRRIHRHTHCHHRRVHRQPHPLHDHPLNRQLCALHHHPTCQGGDTHLSTPHRRPRLRLQIQRHLLTPRLRLPRPCLRLPHPHQRRRPWFHRQCTPLRCRLISHLRPHQSPRHPLLVYRLACRLSARRNLPSSRFRFRCHRPARLPRHGLPHFLRRRCLPV